MPSSQLALDQKRVTLDKPRKQFNAGPSCELSAPEIEQAALQYLNRFACTERKLRQYLAHRIKRRTGAPPSPQSRAAIDALLARYRASGLLNDAVYTESAVRRRRERGASERAISAKLRAQGLAAELIETALQKHHTEHPQGELEAARALVRRRRLGPHRPADERKVKHQRDLGVLARAGFSFEIARRALQAEDEEDEF